MYSTTDFDMKTLKTFLQEPQKKIEFHKISSNFSILKRKILHFV